MFDSLRKIFNEPAEQPAPGSDDLRLATCVLLLETAHADRDFSPQEKERILEIIASRFKLGRDEAAILLAEAGRLREEKGDLYSFARLVNDHYDRPRKLAILELLWEVVYSDHVLEAHEDALMHKLGNLLGVRHEELMALKVKVKGRR